MSQTFFILNRVLVQSLQILNTPNLIILFYSSPKKIISNNHFKHTNFKHTPKHRSSTSIFVKFKPNLIKKIINKLPTKFIPILKKLLQQKILCHIIKKFEPENLKKIFKQTQTQTKKLEEGI